MMDVEKLTRRTETTVVEQMQHDIEYEENGEAQVKKKWELSM